LRLVGSYLGDAWLSRWFGACRRNGRYEQLPDRRPGTIPVDDRRENRQQEDRTMATARRPRKPSVEELAQLAIGLANALARLLDAIHHWH
jgi:hypothetical protein